jgi:hypothetical protein
MPRIRVERPRSAADGIAKALPQVAVITFIALKLTGVVTWSWWWVLSPLWIGGVALALLAGCLVIVWCVARWPVILLTPLRRRARRHPHVVVRFEGTDAGPDSP